MRAHSEVIVAVCYREALLERNPCRRLKELPAIDPDKLTQALIIRAMKITGDYDHTGQIGQAALTSATLDLLQSWCLEG